MMKDRALKVKDGDVTAAVNALLRELLGSGRLDAVLVPQEVPSKRMAFDVLVSDPKRLDASVFAPVMPSSTAATISRMTRERGADRKTGVVMRPCQIRALTELVKINQADLDNLFIIGVDCPGTFSVNTYSEFPDGKDPLDVILDSPGEEGSPAEEHLRTACLACPDPVPVGADVTIGIFGEDLEHEVLVRPDTPKGEELLEGLDLKERKGTGGRDKAVLDLQERRRSHRQEIIERHEELKGIEAQTRFYDKCVNCHNCMKVCPICYCRECLFESSVFDMEGYRYLNKARSKGLYKMPNDSLLFHITRMNHMILSCVGCGLCQQACPSDIPLMDQLIPVAENAQKKLEYEPGRSLDEKIPMVVYREDEFTDVGES
jgi:formate dehydrogenase subunit beta